MGFGCGRCGGLLLMKIGSREVGLQRVVKRQGKWTQRERES